ncbi:TRAF3-interacting protein 1 [Nowakowskiella sp. JEL0407]|nr:TRAF3-interacting protein 1 [Nowakowskiella sp. JEL0407]
MSVPTTQAPTLDDLIKRTIDILGRILKKTPLNPKLLAKPPFRYLHDLIMEIISSTEFANGLYNETEQNSENVKDKDTKVAYLTKVIDCVGVEIRANPLKIVAGLEPEETNLFLQLVGKVVLKKVDTTNAVKRVLAGEHWTPKRPTGAPSNPQKAASKENLARPASAARPVPTQQQPTTQNQVPASQQPRLSNVQPIQQQQSASNEQMSSSGNPQASRPTPASNPPATQPISNEKVVTGKSGSVQDLSHAQTEEKKSTGDLVDETISKQTEVDDGPQVRSMASVRKLRERPASARPAPPKQIKQEVVLEEVPISSPNLNQEVARRQEDDDDEDYVILPNENTEAPIFSNNSNAIDSEKHGGLVKKILETKKDLEGPKSESEDKAETKESNTGKERLPAAKKEIMSLRDSIQILCRSTNPLGKMIDYMQEDVDSMNKELEMWKKESQKYSLALTEQQKYLID